MRALKNAITKLSEYSDDHWDDIKPVLDHWGGLAGVYSNGFDIPRARVTRNEDDETYTVIYDQNGVQNLLKMPTTIEGFALETSEISEDFLKNWIEENSLEIVK